MSTKKTEQTTDETAGSETETVGKSVDVSELVETAVAKALKEALDAKAEKEDNPEHAVETTVPVDEDADPRLAAIQKQLDELAAKQSAAEQSAQAAEQAAKVAEVAKTHGLPDDLVHVLAGKSGEDLEKAAKTLADLTGAASRQQTPDGKAPTGVGPKSTDPDADEIYASLYGGQK